VREAATWEDAEGSGIEDQLLDAFTRRMESLAGGHVGFVPRVGEPAWEGWEEAVRTLFPGALNKPMADRHREAYEFVWDVEADVAYPAQVYVWPRAGGKSTTLEICTVLFGVRRTRRFILYVRETQKQANKSVQNIAAKLQSATIERYYPTLADRAVNRWGLSTGYSQDVLRTADGLVVVALGLDAASRGLKEGDLRPDVIILDDIDGRHDTPEATRKKEETLTDTILGLGTSTTLVFGIQNLIHARSIFSRLVDGTAEYLINRHVVGPIPSLIGFKYEWRYVDELGKRAPVITAGTPTWEGQSVADCQRLLWLHGPRSFIRENQHRVKLVEGALWKEEDIRRTPRPDAFLMVVVGVDPSGNQGKKDPDNEKPGNMAGIVVEGLTYDGKIITLEDGSMEGAPHEWAARAVQLAFLWDADEIVAEANFGGEMVREVITTAFTLQGHRKQALPVVLVNASRGKRIRAEPIAQLAPEGLNLFAGTFTELEDELTTWVPGGPSPNRLDAKVWSSTRLLRYLKTRNRQEATSEGSLVVRTSS
jgi:hypothetical protein